MQCRTLEAHSSPQQPPQDAHHSVEVERRLPADVMRQQFADVQADEHTSVRAADGNRSKSRTLKRRRPMTQNSEARWKQRTLLK